MHTFPFKICVYMGLAHWLRALAVLAEDLVSVSSTHIRQAHNHLKLQLREILDLFRHMHMNICTNKL